MLLKKNCWRKAKNLTYNSLINVAKHEKSTMRSSYIARDIWTPKQRLEFRDVLNELLENDEENNNGKIY